MKISALIPYKPDFGRRDYLWSLVKQRYERFFPYIELCVGVDDNEPFNRARAINRAAKMATGDTFIVVDTDIIFQPDLVRNLVPLVDKHPWIVPFYYGYRLSESGTERLIAEGLPLAIQIGPGPMMNVMKRSCFEEIGGIDERFNGYGYEDVAMAIALDTICGKHFTMDDSIFHLWHQPVTSVPPRNISLVTRYQNAAGNESALRDLINERRKKRKKFTKLSLGKLSKAQSSSEIESDLFSKESEG